MSLVAVRDLNPNFHTAFQYYLIFCVAGCALEQQQNHALQLQVQRFEAEIQSSSLLSSKLAAAEASGSDLQQKFNDADKRAFVAERRADALVQELRVRAVRCAAHFCNKQLVFLLVLEPVCCFHFAWQASVMSYSLELEASSSIRMSSSDVRTAADAVTRLALDNAQQQDHDTVENKSVTRQRSALSPSPPPPPPLEADSVFTSSLTPSNASSPPASHSFSHGTRLISTPAPSLPFTPHSVASNPASRPASTTGQSPSRYPSFDQWLTIKESSFNFGLKESPPSLQSDKSRFAAVQLASSSSRAQTAVASAAVIRSESTVAAAAAIRSHYTAPAKTSVRCLPSHSLLAANQRH
jgi:hypothetical protein